MKNKILGIYEKFPWISMVAAGIIVLFSALQIFLPIGLKLKIVLAVVVLIAFIVVCAAIILKDDGLETSGDPKDMYKVYARSKALRLTENIMTLAYAAVVVLGTFVNSILVIGIGLVLFVMHALLSIIINASYKRLFKKLMK